MEVGRQIQETVIVGLQRQSGWGKEFGSGRESCGWSSRRVEPIQNLKLKVKSREDGRRGMGGMGGIGREGLVFCAVIINYVAPMKLPKSGAWVACASGGAKGVDIEAA